jgi:CRP/FNR family transcriptional regulator, anaerobic regulatory protein
MNIPSSLFKTLLREDLANHAILKTFDSGDLIMSENAFIKSIPIVLDGSIKVMRTDPDGRELLLYYIRPGESCIMSFLGALHQETSKVKAVAEEATTLLLIPPDKSAEWISKYPEWADFMFKLYHRRFEELLQVVNSMAFEKLDQRLEKLLLQKAELYNTKTIQSTHQQLADELGTTREVISRLLKQMENEGLVVLGRNKIQLP